MLKNYSSKLMFPQESLLAIRCLLLVDYQMYSKFLQIVVIYLQFDIKTAFIDKKLENKVHISKPYCSVVPAPVCTTFELSVRQN
jgi:hypothetical protein